MPRYLTPSKICLLALIDLYLSGQTALNAKLSLLSFIASHTNAENVRHDANLSAVAKSLNSDALLFLKPLQAQSSDIPGRNICDVLLQRLWKLQGLDSLHQLFDDFAERVSFVATSEQPRTGVSRASPLGQYIRRCCVEFTRLQFADFQRLWNAFEAWRAPTYEAWAAKNPSDAADLLEAQDSEALLIADVQLSRPGVSSTVGSEDADAILSFSIHQLQKLGTRLPEEVKSSIQSWVSKQMDSGPQSLQHFLAFFEHWKAGQYTMALESLHRYFDYSLVARGSTDNMRVYYQYALLHLSVLHADFDCWNESLEAMDECIATARENQDTGCLNFALSWLLYLRQARPSGNSSSFGPVAGLLGAGGGEEDEVSFLKVKAKESKHWSLLSSTFLDEAKLDMHRRGITPKSFEPIVQSGFLNMLHDLRTLMPVASLFSGASLDRLGQAHLAQRMYDEKEALHGETAPISDRARAACRTAYRDAQAGRYDESLRSLENVAAATQGVLKLEQRVRGFAMLVQMTKSLCHDDVSKARYYLAELQPLRSFSDPEVEFEIFLLEIELLLKRQEPEKAFAMISNHLRDLKDSGNADIGHRLHFLVLKCRLFSVCGRPLRGFSVAIRAALSSARCSLIPLHLEAVVALCDILNELSEFGAVKQLLEACMPMIFESRQAKLLAQALMSLAESYVGSAGFECIAGSSQQTRHIHAAGECIEGARKVYADLEDLSGLLECYTRKAQLARWRGDEASAAHIDALAGQLLADHHSHGSGLV